MSQDYTELAAYIREHFFYKPLTGELFRRSGRGTRKSCGSHVSPYRMTRLGARSFYTHRAIWLWRYGTLPAKPLELDHINQDKHDNRLSNLRAVSRGVNGRNCRSRRGYWFDPRPKQAKKPWRVDIMIDGVRKRKSFATEKEAKDWSELITKQAEDQTEL